MVIDQTAAFGMVDHQILLSRLSDRFLVAGVVLDSPYFIKREQRVCSQTRPRIHHPCHGLSYYPKRQSFARSFSSATRHQFMASFMHLISILSAYTVRIQDIMHAHLIPTMTYTDDTPLYIQEVFWQRSGHEEPSTQDKHKIILLHSTPPMAVARLDLSIHYSPSDPTPKHSYNNPNRQPRLMMNWLLSVVPQPFGTRSQTQNSSVNNLKHISLRDDIWKQHFQVTKVHTWTSLVLHSI